MRHLQLKLLLGVLAFTIPISTAQTITCPTGTATSTANPVIISACSELNSIISAQVATGGPAVATVYVTLPASTTTMAITTSLTTTTSITTTTSSSSGSRRSHRRSSRTGKMSPSSAMHGGHSTMHTSKTHRTRTTRTQTPGGGGANTSPAAASHTAGAGVASQSYGSGDDNYTTGVVIPVAVVCTVVPALLLAWLLWFCLRRRRRHRLAAGSPAASVEPINLAKEPGPSNLAKESEPSAHATSEKPLTSEKPPLPAENESISRSAISSNPPQLAYLFGPEKEQLQSPPLSPPVLAQQPQPPASTGAPPEPFVVSQPVQPTQSEQNIEHPTPRRDSDEARGVSGLAALPEETDHSSSTQDAGSEVMRSGGTWFAPSIQEDDEGSEPSIPQEPLPHPQQSRPPPIPDVSPDRQKRSSSSWLSLASRHSLTSSTSGAQTEPAPLSPPPPPPPPLFPAPPRFSPSTSGYSTPRRAEAYRAGTLRQGPYTLYPR